MTFAWRHRRNAIPRWYGRKSRSRSAPRALRFRPILEWLEDRTVPALFFVNRTLDTAAVNLLTGQDGDGNISLRSAIMAANFTPGPDTIQLPSGSFSLTRGGVGENFASTGDLDIRDSLTLIGSGTATTTIDAENLDRVFEILGGVNVTIQNLTITGGRVTGVGGGIANAGKLTLEGTILSNNSALGQNGSASLSSAGVGGSVNGFGGGIYNSGTLTITSSTITNNTAQGGQGGSNSSYGSGGGGGGMGAGGGLYNDGGFVTIQASTFENNQAIGGNGNFGGPGNFSQGFGGGGGSDGGDGGNAGFGATSGTSGNYGGGGGGGGSGAGLANGGNGGLGGFGGGGGGGGSTSGSFSPGNLGSGGFGAGDGGFGGNFGGGGGGGGGLGAGGAIFSNSGTVIISGSTITGNTAQGGNGGSVEAEGFAKGGDGGDGVGAGLFAVGSSIQMNNSTVTGNSVQGGNGGSFYKTSPFDITNFTPGSPGAGYDIFLSTGEMQIVSEGDFVDLFGSFSALVPGQAHTVIIDWGDGTPDTILNLSGGVTNFFVNHFYDDIPLQGIGYQPISVQIINTSGLQTVSGTKFLAENVAPTGDLTNSGPVPEGSSAVVEFVEQFDPSQSDTAAGFLYSFDFNGDGVFEIVESTSASAVVPPEFLANGPDNVTVTGRIRDNDGGFNDFETTISIQNTAPVVTTPTDVIIGLGQSQLGTGSFVDPGQEEWLVQVDYGDGSEPVFVPYDADKTFVLDHAYASEGNYRVTVTVTEIEGESGQCYFTVYVLPAPPLDSDIAFTDGNGVATATIPGQISATLVLSGPTRTPAAIIVSVLPNEAAGGTGQQITISESNPDGTVTLKTYDVRVINASANDRVTVTFLVESPTGQTPNLEFIDPRTGIRRPVQGSTLVSPSFTVRQIPGSNVFEFTVVFDSTSSPTTRELFGTVFTFSGPQTPPPAPVPNLPNLLIQANSQSTFVSTNPSLNSGGVPTTGFLSGTDSRFVVSSSTSLTSSSGAGSSDESGEQDATVAQALRWINDIHMAGWGNMDQNQANNNTPTPQEEEKPPEFNDPNNMPQQQEASGSGESFQEGNQSLLFTLSALDRWFAELSHQVSGVFLELESTGTFDVFDALEEIAWLPPEMPNGPVNLLWSFIPLALGTLVPLRAPEKTPPRKVFLAPKKGKQCFPVW